MENKTLKIADLKPAKYNPRKIAEWELKKLAHSIEVFGFVDPVIVNKDMTIIGGHQRVKAAEQLGMTEVPCVVVDLPPGKEKALNLALNKISGEWDNELLVALLKEMDEADLKDSGFDPEEIEKAIEAAGEPDNLAGEFTETPFRMTITFKTSEDMENAGEEIKEVLENYEGASYTVSGGKQ